MAEGKIFLKENRDRIEKKYREQMMGLPQVFAEIDKKACGMHRRSGSGVQIFICVHAVQ